MNDLNKTGFHVKIPSKIGVYSKADDTPHIIADLERKISELGMDWFEVIDKMSPEFRETLGQMLYAYSANEAAKDNREITNEY